MPTTASTAPTAPTASTDALMRTGLMQVPVAVVMFDSELRIVGANAAAGRLACGPSATEWAGRRLGDVLPGMDADLIERSLRRVLATGEPVFELEVSSHDAGDPGADTESKNSTWAVARFHRATGPFAESGNDTR